MMKKSTSAAIPLAAPQASQSSASTRISRWTKREANGVGMRCTTPRSVSRLPQAMAKRPEYQHVLEPLDPAPLLDRGSPLGDDAFDVRAPAVFEPLGRFLVELADEGVADDLNEFRVRRHVVLPSAKIRSGPSRRLSPSSYRNDLHPLASTPDGGVG